MYHESQSKISQWSNNDVSQPPKGHLRLPKRASQPSKGHLRLGARNEDPAFEASHLYALAAYGRLPPHSAKLILQAQHALMEAPLGLGRLLGPPQPPREECLEHLPSPQQKHARCQCTADSSRRASKNRAFEGMMQDHPPFPFPSSPSPLPPSFPFEKIVGKVAFLHYTVWLSSIDFLLTFLITSSCSCLSFLSLTYLPLSHRLHSSIYLCQPRKNFFPDAAI